MNYMKYMSLIRFVQFGYKIRVQSANSFLVFYFVSSSNVSLEPLFPLCEVGKLSFALH